MRKTLNAPAAMYRAFGTAALGLTLVLAATGCSAASNESQEPMAADTGASAPESAATASSQPAESTTAPSSAAPDLSDSTTGSPSQKAREAASVTSVGNGQHKYAVVAATASTPSAPAELSGKLILADQGCFHLTSNQGAPVLLVFPKGTTVAKDGKPAVMVAGDRHVVGERLLVSGEKTALLSKNVDQAAPCRANGDVFRVSSIGN